MVLKPVVKLICVSVVDHSLSSQDIIDDDLKHISLTRESYEKSKTICGNKGNIDNISHYNNKELDQLEWRSFSEMQKDLLSMVNVESKQVDQCRALKKQPDLSTAELDSDGYTKLIPKIREFLVMEIRHSKNKDFFVRHMSEFDPKRKEVLHFGML